MKTTLALVLVTLATANAFYHYTDFSSHMIKDVNSKEGLTWTAGHNSNFEKMTLSQIQQMLGSLEEPHFMKLPEKTEYPKVTAIPENFDVRVEWGFCESTKEIRDQSICGSCWAFGAAEAFSDRWCIASNGQSQVRMSTENLLSCGGIFVGTCNGGYPSQAWRYIQQTGLVSGNLYGQENWCQPYSLPPCAHHTDNPEYPPCSDADAQTPPCKKSCTGTSFSTPYNQDIYKVKSSYSISGVSNIQSDIMTYGSVEGSFTVYEDFLTYKSGVYQWSGKGKQLGGHAIKILGWGVENGTPYWLCANSWNESWGDNGYFKILRGQNECGIESGVVAGQI